MKTSERAHLVSARDRVSAYEYNKLVRGLNASNRIESASTPEPYQSVIIQTAEVNQLDFANNKLVVIEPGTLLQGQPFDVLLPDLYTEASRNFGGTIGTVSYTYTDTNTRTATGSSGSETQHLTPPIVVGEVIQIAHMGGEGDYVMVGDGRMWAVDP